jgi:N-acyl-D-aspartate/D-glutamate deacylase
MTFDVLIKGARVFHGDSPALHTDFGIAGDRIATLEHSLPATNAAEVIDATDLMLCPGFIDMHAHTALESFRDPRLEPKVAQGFTTEVINQTGLAGCSREVMAQRQNLFVFLAPYYVLPANRWKKRREWDSNPRDDLTPPTRFPISKGHLISFVRSVLIYPIASV